MRLAVTSILALLMGTPAFGTLSVVARDDSICSFQLTGGLGGGLPIEEPFVGNETVSPCFIEPPPGFFGSKTASQFADQLSGDGTDTVSFEARFGVEASRAHTAVVTTSTTSNQGGDLIHSLTVDVDVPPGADWELEISHSMLGAIGGLDGFASGSAAVGDLLLEGNGPDGPFSSTLQLASAVDTGPLQFGPPIPVELEVSDSDALTVTGTGDATIDLTVSLSCGVTTTQRSPAGGDYAVCLFGLDGFGPNPDPYAAFGRDAELDGYQLTLALSLPTECNDGTDNDGDGHIDLDDPQCGGDPLRRSEAGYPRRCGLGFEAAFALLPWAAARRYRRRRSPL